MLTSEMKTAIDGLVSGLADRGKSFTSLELGQSVESHLWDMFNSGKLPGYTRQPVTPPGAVVNTWEYIATPVVVPDKRGRVCIPASIARSAGLNPKAVAWVYAFPSTQEIVISSSKKRKSSHHRYTVDKKNNVRVMPGIRKESNTHESNKFYAFLRNGDIVMRPVSLGR